MTTRARRQVFRALHHRNYKLFFGGQLISLSGTWMQSVAQAWLVYRMTGSAALLGLVAFSSQIPVLVLAPLGGTAADRYNRHRILIVTQTAAMILALSLASLTLSGNVQVWHLFVFAGLLGVVNAFDLPARPGWAGANLTYPQKMFTDGIGPGDPQESPEYTQPPE